MVGITATAKSFTTKRVQLMVYPRQVKPLIANVQEAGILATGKSFDIKRTGGSNNARNW